MERIEYNHSWFIFIRPILTLVVGVLIAVVFDRLIVIYNILPGIFRLFAVVFAVIWTGINIYQIVYFNSEKLVIDDAGVWIYSGLLPWDKGREGLNWAIVGESYFYEGFISWLIKSFPVIVEHKHRDNTEQMKIVHIKNGDQAVSKINSMIDSYVDLN